MKALLDLSLPVPFLMYCLNAVVTSLVVCSIAVVLSRRTAWSLPTRHALLCGALVASLLAPAILPLVPSVWEINFSKTAPEPKPTVVVPPVEIAPEETTLPRPEAAVPPVVEADTTPATTTPSPTPVPASVVDPSPPLQRPEEPSLTLGEWARLLGTLCCGVWSIGFVVGTARTVVGLRRLRSWLQTVTIADSPRLAETTRRAADSVGLGHPPPLYRSRHLPVPVTVGLFRPRIVVPVGLETSLSPDQLQAVLQHEMAHIARRDAWIGLLQSVVAIMYWWNPLCGLANRRLEDLREQICDDIAIADLPDPSTYAITLLEFAERFSVGTPVPATLSIGSSSASQLEQRIRHIGSPSDVRSLRLTRGAAVGVVATVILMTATILCAQVRVQEKAKDPTPTPQPTPSADKPGMKPLVGERPTLKQLIQKMAVYERRYLPYDIEAMETFRFPENLTPQERAKNSRADGRKHQKLMEYAQRERRIWRSKETEYIDEKLNQGPYERFSDGERIVQISASPPFGNTNKNRQYHVNKRKNEIFNFLHATPLCGVFCLSSYGGGELFSKAFKDGKGVQLAWDNGDAKLTFGYGKPHWNFRFVLWLSRDHEWHPIRLQRFWDAKDKLFYDEWEVTKFVQRGKVWRVAEGTHRYHDHREVKLPKAKIKYSMDFEVRKAKYGKDVDRQQFEIDIPPGAVIDEDEKPQVPPTPPAKSRKIKVRVLDVAGRPIPNATVRLPASPSRDWDVVKTDDKGVVNSAKAPKGNVSVQITAVGYRPVTWILGNVNELRAIMVPESTGVVTDQGKPVVGAWITNKPYPIRADGFASVPNRNFRGRYEDWSNGEGLFELKTNLTLRRRDTVVPLIAVNENRDKMAIRFVPADELGQKQKLVLEPVCHVVGHCLLEGMTEEVALHVGLESSDGRSLGSLTTRRERTPAGLRLDYQVRLPPGEYVLRSRSSSYHPGFRIPVKIPAGKDTLDLGTKTVSAAGAISLRGKPAPELKVRWRAGQETTWENLRGKVVVIDFWGTWCVPCVKDMPLLMEIADQFRDKPVQWLSIHTPNLTTFDELDRGIAVCREKSWNKRPLPFTTVLDTPVKGRPYSGQTSQRYGVAEWPTLIVVDQQGKVVGPILKQRLAETIARLLDR